MQHFCAVLGAQNGKPRLKFAPEAVQLLRLQPWPGNVRQLQNFVERLVVFAESDAVDVAAVRVELGVGVGNSACSTGTAALDFGTSVLELDEVVRRAERKALKKRCARRTAIVRWRPAFSVLVVVRSTTSSKNTTCSKGLQGTRMALAGAQLLRVCDGGVAHCVGLCGLPAAEIPSNTRRQGAPQKIRAWRLFRLRARLSRPNARTKGELLLGVRVWTD